jgi:hypothetical protein
VRATLASFEHEITPEVSFGGKRIVRRAVQRKVLGRGRSTTRERLVMVELQSRRLATAFAAFIHEGTAMPVPLEDRTTNDSRHAPPALAGSVLS